MGSIFRTGISSVSPTPTSPEAAEIMLMRRRYAVLYHQPEKMAKSKEDIAERQENLEKLKREHGIE